jgi:hypothetical protein
MSKDRDTYEASDGTTFDTRYRDQDVDLYIAGDHTIIASPHAVDDEESSTGDED